MNAMTADERTAPAGDQPVDGQVVLMNRFAVRPDRDDAFHELWTSTSKYFRAQPGFVSLRLHRAISSDAEYRWVNVATWESEADFRAAHASDEFRKVVTRPGWDEFPSSPMLFEVVTWVG
jgi:heme-degrading monooxygenase HmoA